MKDAYTEIAAARADGEAEAVVVREALHYYLRNDPKAREIAKKFMDLDAPTTAPKSKR